MKAGMLSLTPRTRIHALPASLTACILLFLLGWWTSDERIQHGQGSSRDPALLGSYFGSFYSPPCTRLSSDDSEYTIEHCASSALSHSFRIASLPCSAPAPSDVSPAPFADAPKAYRLLLTGDVRAAAEPEGIYDPKTCTTTFSFDLPLGAQDVFLTAYLTQTNYTPSILLQHDTPKQPESPFLPLLPQLYQLPLPPTNHPRPVAPPRDPALLPGAHPHARPAPPCSRMEPTPGWFVRAHETDVNMTHQGYEWVPDGCSMPPLHNLRGGEDAVRRWVGKERKVLMAGDSHIRYLYRAFEALLSRDEAYFVQPPRDKYRDISRTQYGLNLTIHWDTHLNHHRALPCSFITDYDTFFFSAGQHGLTRLPSDSYHTSLQTHEEYITNVRGTAEWAMKCFAEAEEAERLAGGKERGVDRKSRKRVVFMTPPAKHPLMISQKEAYAPPDAADYRVNHVQYARYTAGAEIVRALGGAVVDGFALSEPWLEETTDGFHMLGTDGMWAAVREAGWKMGLGEGSVD